MPRIDQLKLSEDAAKLIKTAGSSEEATEPKLGAIAELDQVSPNTSEPEGKPSENSDDDLPPSLLGPRK